MNKSHFLAVIGLATLVFFTFTSSKAALAAQDVYILQDDGTIISANGAVDIENAIKKFYAVYPDKDIYDFLSFFTTAYDPTHPNYHLPVKNDISGIGPSTSDSSSMYGNVHKLIGVNFLNASFHTYDTSLIKSNFELITHETTHQWLMYIGDTRNCTTDCKYQNLKFRSADGSHYARWADTGFIREGMQWVDVDGGFIWQDNGNGTFSTVHEQKTGLSPLSLYLMGLSSPSEVPDFKYIIPDDPGDITSTTIKATGAKISIGDIVSKYGARNPSSVNSQKNFTMAYILLTKKGETPTSDQLSAINYISDNYSAEWAYQTYYKSTMNGSAAVSTSTPTPISNPSPAPIKAPVQAVRFEGEPKVYVVQGTKIKWVPDLNVFNSLGLNWTSVKVIPMSEKTNFQRVKLVRAEKDQKIYYITEGGLKRHIPNIETFNSYGNSWQDVVAVKDFELSAIPDNQLIRQVGDTKVYKLENGAKRWIKTAEAFNSLGLSWTQIAPVNSVEINNYPEGSAIE